MGPRRVLTLVFLPLLILLERFAFYGSRSYLALYLRDELAMSARDAGMTWSGINGILVISPLIGGAVAAVAGPRWTLLAGTVMVAGAHALLGQVPGGFVTGVLVLLMIGEGFVRPTVLALVARELGDPREGARSGLMIAIYGAVNIAGWAAAPVAGLIVKAADVRMVFSIMGWTAFGPIVLALVIALLPKLMGDDPPPTEKPGALRGTLVVLGLYVPAALAMGLIDQMPFTNLPWQEHRWVEWLNPMVVTIACGAAGLAVTVLAVVPVKWPLKVPIAIGSFMVALACAAVLSGDDHGAVTLASATVLGGVGEVLVTPFAMALMSGGLPDGRASLIMGGWLASTHALGYLGSTASTLHLGLPAIAVCAALCIGAGVLLLVKKDPVEKWGA